MTDDPEYDVDFRENPDAYEIGRGEQGAFKIEPYKSELLPLWGIKTLDEAETGASAIHEQFQEYKREGEFPGMDMARKYLQMGWTRSLRYAKYPGGQKYEISQVYREYLDEVNADEEYRRQRAEWESADESQFSE